ncbi:YhgE/Pip domain-containing protein [Sporolactobacillus sp. KGMB 08714]|uniref:YhgE/Pip domain-containing protein n=1 Tax=Sporolactobacillus sp. KGMB 08714 TaxID=3064704 RepID=UPI002FBEFD65
MNVIQLIWAELKTIVSKPHNIVVMVAVMCVPLLYAGMFLYGFWNAFGKTGNLPVAVVNQDNGTKIAGKQIQAGHDLVTNLKKNHDFKWQFVSEKAAQDGFKNNHYFMIVRIPASFSKNATTLSDSQLKPANIYYRINRDYNFISGKMADAGVQKLKTSIANEITKTYAKSMYTQIDQLTKGLGTAAKGSNDLAGGGKAEVEGLNQLKSGYQTLMSGTAELQNGAASLASGASQLNTGAAQLAGGASAVSSGAGKLASGATTLNSGAGQLRQGIGQYTGAVGGQLLPGANQLSNGLNQLNGGIQSQNLVGQVSQLNSGMQEFNSIIQGLPGQINSSIDPAAIGQSAVNSAISQGLSGQSKKSASDLATEVTGSIGQSISSSGTQSAVSAGIQENSDVKTSLEPLFIAMVEKENPGMTDAQAKPYADQAMAKQLPALANAIAQSATESISGNVKNDSSAIAAALQPSLQQSAEDTIRTTASSTASQIKDGIASSFTQKDQTTGLTLNQASQQLADGTSQLAGNNGVPLIASSVSQLLNGAGQLSGGLNTLNGNSAALNNGASAVTSGASSLAGGASSLSNGSQQLVGGTNKLSNGAGALSSGANTLASGLNSAASGQQKLASATNQITGGAQKIYNGNAKLAGNLADAHSQLADTPTNDAHATKFSQPVTSIDASYQSVSTFGSGFTPYFICIGLFVGALLLTIIYDLGKPAGLATAGWNIALSKYFITILMSVGQALLVDLAVLKGLDLQVNHPLTFIGFTILTSMSFMAIIQWLAGSFNNEGRFIAIVILLFQLVTSGGAYAIELIPKWLQHISPFLPMTYGVNGFRNLIDGNQHQMLVGNSLALLVFILIFLTLSIITFSIKFRFDRVHSKAAYVSSEPDMEDNM